MHLHVAATTLHLQLALEVGVQLTWMVSGANVDTAGAIHRDADGAELGAEGDAGDGLANID